MDALLCKINYAFHKASSKNRLEFHILFEIKLKGKLRVFYLYSNGEVVLFDVFIIERMVNFDVSPCMAIVGTLLQVERVVLVGLSRRATNKPVEDGRITFDPRTILNRCHAKTKD